MKPEPPVTRKRAPSSCTRAIVAPRLSTIAADVRSVRDRRTRPSAGDCDGREDGRLARPSRARRRRRVRRRRRRVRLPPARDHRPQRGRHAAVRERRRRAAADAQRRGLQLPRAPPRARGPRTSLPERLGHGGDPPRVRAVGRPLRRALQRHVGDRALGRTEAAALRVARPLRGEAVLLPLGRRPVRLRERAEGVPCRGPARALTSPQSATTSSRATSTTPTRRSSRGSASSRRPTRSSSTRTACGSSATGRSSRAPSRTATRAEEVRELFLDAVRLRLRSDVPVGTCLSGGIDSSAIVCVVDHLLRTEAENARPVGERQRTFTAFFEEPGLDERPYAEAVVERTRSQPHWITFGTAELVDALPRDRPRAGRAVRLDVDRRAVVRAARGEGGGPEGDARRPGRGRDARGLPRVLRSLLRRPPASGQAPRARRGAARVPDAARRGRRDDGGRARSALPARACALGGTGTRARRHGARASGPPGERGRRRQRQRRLPAGGRCS